MHVAKEMERKKFKVPLLIGGATTSKWVLWFLWPVVGAGVGVVGADVV